MARGSELIPSSKRTFLKSSTSIQLSASGPGILTIRVPEPLSLTMLLLCTFLQLFPIKHLLCAFHLFLSPYEGGLMIQTLDKYLFHVHYVLGCNGKQRNLSLLNLAICFYLKVESL